MSPRSASTWPPAAHRHQRPAALRRPTCRPPSKKPATSWHERPDQRRARDHRDDLRLVRQPHRAQAQQAARRRSRPSTTPPRRRRSAIEDGVGTDDLIAAVEAAGYAADAARPGHTGCGGVAGRPRPVRCGPGSSSRRCSRSRSSRWRWSRRCSSPTGSGSRSPWPRRSWSGAGSLPPGGLDQPAARRRHHGHARLAGHARRVRLVALRAVLRHRRRGRDDAPLRVDHPADRRRGQHLPRGRRRGDHVHPRRPLLRGPVQAAGRRRAARAARARAPRTSRCCATVSRSRIPVEDLVVGDRLRRPARGEDRHRRRGRGGRLGGRRLDAHRRVGAGRGRASATPWSARRSTPAAGWSCAPPGSARTPSSPRWPAWSRTPRTARPRCSGWPTGSPGSSCRS